MRVLVLNAGSSSLKASLVDSAGTRLATSEAEWPPSADDAKGAPSVVADALAALPEDANAEAVGYRVVHGGDAFRGPARIDERLIATVEKLDELAPLHNRRAALVMRSGLEALPEPPHVACFDTAFHADLSEQARRYALPSDWVDAHGLRRFGFHGLSVDWSVRRAAELLGRPADALALVVAHLGSGCSVTAVLSGSSVATSMGFTPLEGMVMGSRSGSVDPGILLHLLRVGMTPDELEDGIAARSGLLALSGATSDVRRLEAAANAGDGRARLGLDIFARSAAAAIGAAATALSGLDALVFTGGIGEGSASMRGAIAGRLSPLGISPSLGDADGDGVLAVGPPAVVVVEAQEDRVIAAEVARLLHDGPRATSDLGTAAS